MIDTPQWWQEVLRANQDIVARLSAVAVKLEMLEDLHTIVVRGNGHPGLVTRFALMEQHLSHMRLCIDDGTAKFLEMERERRRVKWAFMTALSASLLAGILSIAGIVFGRWIK